MSLWNRRWVRHLWRYPWMKQKCICRWKKENKRTRGTDSSAIHTISTCCWGGTRRTASNRSVGWATWIIVKASGEYMVQMELMFMRASTDRVNGSTQRKRKRAPASKIWISDLTVSSPPVFRLFLSAHFYYIFCSFYLFPQFISLFYLCSSSVPCSIHISKIIVIPRNLVQNQWFSQRVVILRILLGVNKTYSNPSVTTHPVFKFGRPMQFFESIAIALLEEEAFSFANV